MIFLFKKIEKSILIVHLTTIVLRENVLLTDIFPDKKKKTGHFFNNHLTV